MWWGFQGFCFFWPAFQLGHLHLHPTILEENLRSFSICSERNKPIGKDTIFSQLHSSNFLHHHLLSSQFQNTPYHLSMLTSTNQQLHSCNKSKSSKFLLPSRAFPRWDHKHPLLWRSCPPSVECFPRFSKARIGRNAWSTKKWTELACWNCLDISKANQLLEMGGVFYRRNTWHLPFQAAKEQTY